MSKRKKIVLVSLAALTICSIGIVVLPQQPEPVFQGHPISEWLHAAKTGLPVGTVRGKPLPARVPIVEARAAVSAIGPKALPYIASAAGGDISAMSKLYWRIYLSSPGPVVRRLPLPPARGNKFKPGVVMGLFYAATEHADASAIPILAPLSGVSNVNVRRAAVLCLLRLEPKNPKKVLTVIQMTLHDEDPAVQALSFKYLSKRAAEEPAAKQSITEFLKQTGTNAPEWMRNEGAEVLQSPAAKDHSTLEPPQHRNETDRAVHEPHALPSASNPQRSMRSVVSQEMQASVMEMP